MLSIVVCDTAKVRFFKQITTLFKTIDKLTRCLRYCKSTIFQANHNLLALINLKVLVVCDTAKVRFFKQITTNAEIAELQDVLFAILQKYDFSSKSQHNAAVLNNYGVVCDTAKVRFFKQITTERLEQAGYNRCLRYCKSTIFQANHNLIAKLIKHAFVVCDTAKVRFFKQITTGEHPARTHHELFAILQKYDFSSKSQLELKVPSLKASCLRYCKSTIFQANHNALGKGCFAIRLFAILQKYDFSSKSQPPKWKRC